jgi:hypothetical protein
MTIKTKKVVFVCLVIMVCLYGCESWAVTEEIKRMLRKFQYRCLRDMLKVSKAKQIQDKVSRIQLLQTLGMEDVLYYMRYLQLKDEAHGNTPATPTALGILAPRIPVSELPTIVLGVHQKGAPRDRDCGMRLEATVTEPCGMGPNYPAN